MRLNFGLIATAILLLLSTTSHADVFLNVSADEPVGYPNDAIPFSEVERCIETESEYSVNGIIILADTIWVSDPNGIEIVEDVSLDHDYVFSLLGFKITESNLTLEGNDHNIIFDNDDIYYYSNIYGIYAYGARSYISIQNCNLRRT